MSLTEDVILFLEQNVKDAALKCLHLEIKLSIFMCFFPKQTQKLIINQFSGQLLIILHFCFFFKTAHNLVCVDDVTVKTKKVISSSIIITIIIWYLYLSIDLSFFFVSSLLMLFIVFRGQNDNFTLISFAHDNAAAMSSTLCPSVLKQC